MKIVHLVQGYYPAIGGTEHLMQRVSEHLARDFGDQVSVLTLNTTSAEAFIAQNPKRLPLGTEYIDGVKVSRYPVTDRFAPLLYWAQLGAVKFGLPGNDWLRTLYGGPISLPLLQAAYHEPGDVIAASSFPLLHMQYALWAGERRRLPVILYGGLHPEDRWGFDRALIYKSIARADRYVAYTTFERDYLVRRGICPEKIAVVGLGTDPERFEQADGAAVRERYGLGDAPVVAFIGQQGGHKGIDTLVRAMQTVWRKFPDTRLLIAGSRSRFSAHLDSLIAGLGRKRKNVVVVDNFAEDEKPQLFAACDLFAYPSGFESFGIAFLEAWACRKPVIGCRSGAVPSVVEEWSDGLLVPYQDVPQLASAIIELLADPRLRQRFGENGYRKVCTRHTWTNVAAELRQVYDDAIRARFRAKYVR